MTNAQKNFIEYHINRGMSQMQACELSLSLAVPEMAFQETAQVLCEGVAYSVFRGGPDYNPWYNFSKA